MTTVMFFETLSRMTDRPHLDERTNAFMNAIAGNLMKGNAGVKQYYRVLDIMRLG